MAVYYMVAPPYCKRTLKLSGTFKNFSDLVLGHFTDISELILAMAEFHDALAAALEIKHFGLSLCDDCAWKLARTG